jgi:hypothetical protein
VHRHRLPVLPLLDYAAPALAAGLIIGRASHLITGDHLGKHTGLPWGFRYIGTDPPGTPPPLGAIVHPVALYDLLLVAILLAVLVVLLRTARSPGSAAALFALWYSLDRLLLDFLRTDTTRALGLTGTQLASIAVIAVVALWLWQRGRGGHPAPPEGELVAARETTPRPTTGSQPPRVTPQRRGGQRRTPTTAHWHTGQRDSSPRSNPPTAYGRRFGALAGTLTGPGAGSHSEVA